MKYQELNEYDKTLIQETTAFFEQKYQTPRHQIVAGLLAKSGSTYLSTNLKSNVGKAEVCAEAIALGNAINAGEKKLITVVAMKQEKKLQKAKVVPPCGPCRELLSDFAPQLFVIIEFESKLVKYPIAELLPHRYTV